MYRIIANMRINTYSEIIHKVEPLWEEEKGMLVENLKNAENTPGEDEDYLSYLADQLADIEYYTLPTCRYALFQGIWSFFEDCLNTLCGQIAHHDSSRIKLKDLNGQGVERSQNYLIKIGKLDIDRSIGKWQQIKCLNDLRNIIVHRDGRIKMNFDDENEEFQISKADKPVVDFLNKNDIGDLSGTSLYLNDKFLSFTITLIKDVINDTYDNNEKMRPSSVHL